MQNRKILSLILVVITVVTISSSERQLISAIETVDIIISKIRLCGTADPQSSVSVMFESSTNGVGKVEYGLTDQLGDTVTLNEDSFIHEL